MAIVLIRQDDKLEAWSRAIREFDKKVTVYSFNEPHPEEEVRMAMVWKHPKGVLSKYPNLQAIHSLGAGVDFILDDPEVPAHIPVCRVVDPYLSADMAEFVLARILEHVKGFRRMQREADKAVWNPGPYQRLSEVRVGILGYGELGSELADVLGRLNCSVHAWARTPKDQAPVRVYAGQDALDEFLSISDILVCLLPLTPETRGLLNLSLFSRLPSGAFLINVARGGHLVEPDLLTALDKGFLSGAALDVFENEPLPPDHPFWSREEIAISPHVASVSEIETVVPQLLANYHRLLAGDALKNRISADRGY